MANIRLKKQNYNIYSLPLFSWAFEQNRKPLSFPALYLAGKYHLKPVRAKLIAELMGLGESANDNL